SHPPTHAFLRRSQEPGRAAAAGPPAPHTGGLPALPRSAGPAGRGGVEEEEARTGSTHRARRASPDRPRRPARSGGEGPGGGAARAPIWKCQLRSAAGPQPRRKRKSLRLPQAHPPARPSPGGTPSPWQGLKQTPATVAQAHGPGLATGVFFPRLLPAGLVLTSRGLEIKLRMKRANKLRSHCRPGNVVCLTTTWSPGLASLSLGLVPSITACTRPWMQVIQSSRKDCTQESHLAKN
uniref:Uncharacterized protein n=1 Tax=Mustela putorius furo TaxID=9669 RepID=M3XQJ4_MUSPF